MNILLEKISEESFNNLTSKVLFNDSTTSRCFGEINGAPTKFRLGWQSDLIDPVISELVPGIFGVGIDQNFAIADFNTGNELLNLNLDYSFLTLQKFEESLFVISELEVIEIDLSNFTVINTHALPDLYQDIEKKDGYFEISCEGGFVVKIDLAHEITRH